MGDKLGNWADKIGKFIQDVGTAIYEEQKEPVSDAAPDILTAGKLSQLKWLSATQLAAIYKYGKVPTRIDDDPDAYAQLKWFNSNQLKAIFGDDDV